MNKKSKMKCFVMRHGGVVPADQVVEIAEKDGKTIIKYKKHMMLAGIERTMTCYDEAIGFRNMKEGEI